MARVRLIEFRLELAPMTSNLYGIFMSFNELTSGLPKGCLFRTKFVACECSCGFRVALSIIGCNHADNQSNTGVDSDTLVVVASRLFESRTYQDFLEPIAAPRPIRWYNASELSPEELSAALAEANGVLLTGGADIHPERYEQAADTSRCGNIDLERDALESFLLNEVDRARLPFLGICRGMQFMNVHGGGSLHPHLPDVLGHNGHRGGAAGNTSDTTHAVRALRQWSSANWQIGDSSTVVSHHHQGIDRLADGLEAWADGPRRIDRGGGA